MPWLPVHRTEALPTPERLGVHPHETGPLVSPSLLRASSITPKAIAHEPAEQRV